MGVEAVVAPAEMVVVCTWEKNGYQAWAIMSPYGSEGTY